MNTLLYIGERDVQRALSESGFRNGAFKNSSNFQMAQSHYMVLDQTGKQLCRAADNNRKLWHLKAIADALTPL